MTVKEMEVGKIYFVSYGGNTQLVLRYKGERDCTSQLHYDCLHYWNGFESFHKESYFVNSGIDEIRRATKAEKHALIRLEIEHDVI